MLSTGLLPTLGERGGEKRVSSEFVEVSTNAKLNTWCWQLGHTPTMLLQCERQGRSSRHN